MYTLEIYACEVDQIRQLSIICDIVLSVFVVKLGKIEEFEITWKKKLQEIVRQREFSA